MTRELQGWLQKVCEALHEHHGAKRSGPSCLMRVFRSFCSVGCAVGMLGTPFQFGKPIQFDSSASFLTGWKRYSSGDRPSKPTNISSKCWGSPVSIKPSASLSTSAGLKTSASMQNTLSHGWLTYAPITIVPSATSKSGTGRNMSITLRDRKNCKDEASLERVQPAAYQNAKAHEAAAAAALPGVSSLPDYLVVVFVLLSTP